MSLSVKVENEQDFLNGIKKVRLDSDPTDWAVVGHFNDDPNKVELVATGSDGYDGLINCLREDKVQYALLRVTTTVDFSLTVKFVYIHLIGSKVGFAKRGKYSVVHGAVKPYLQPSHVEFEIETLSEIKLDIITSKVEKAAGNADFVRSGAYAAGKPEYGKNQNQKEASNVRDTKPTNQPNTVKYTAGPAAPGPWKPTGTSSTQAKMDGKQGSAIVPSAVTQSQNAAADPALSEALKLLRSNQKQINWVSAHFPETNTNKPLVLLDKGPNGFDSYAKHLQPDTIVYIYVKVVDIIDGNETIKFALINWIGPNVGSLKKAKLVTLKGAINQTFSPFHVVYIKLIRI